VQVTFPDATGVYPEPFEAIFSNHMARVHDLVAINLQLTSERVSIVSEGLKVTSSLLHLCDRMA
jgi:hypothetical protein